MPVYSKADFARLLDRKNSYVTTNIERGKLIVTATGEIDDKNPLNKMFIEKFFAKHGASDQATAKVSVAVAPVTKRGAPSKLVETVYVDFEDDDNPAESAGSLAASEKKYKHHLATKTERESELKRLQIEKLKGEVIPTAPIAALIFKFKQFISTQARIAYDAFLNEIKQKYEITGADTAYYRGFFTKLLNNSMETANLEFISALDTLLAEFSVKRGVGEHD